MTGAPESRVERLAGKLAAEGLDLLIVGDLVRPGESSREAAADLRWLTGFSGTSGVAVIGPRERVFLTDFRYEERARDALPGGFELVRIEGRFANAIAGRLRGRVGFEEAATSVLMLRRLREEADAGVELVGVQGLVAELRRQKDGREIATISEAARLSDEVLAGVADEGLVGRTEREVAVAIETRMRELGAEGASFPPIVAAAEHSALPHAEPSQREIGRGEVVVIDLGAVVDGYCSDGTRTLATGELDAEAREVYELVLDAQRRGLDAVAPGIRGAEADSAAREPIAAAGYGELFGHGLGHGVGIEVHEPPRLSSRSEDTLAFGDVVTVEPGIYLPGRFGVRIEDLVVVEEDGIRNLSSFPKHLQTLG